MPYLDRLRTARYQAPSGALFTFEFRDLERRGGKKAPIHEPPQQDEAPVQDLGNTAQRYPIEATFSGADYDTTADAFFTALTEQGPGTLLHPRWGDIPVLALTWTQRESFIADMRQAVFEIDFVRTPEVQSLRTAGLAQGEIGAGVEDAADSGADDIGPDLEPVDAGESARVKASLSENLAEFKANIEGVIANVEDIAAQFEAGVLAFENNLDAAILTPITLAQSFISLARSPARAITSVRAKLEGYRASIDTLIGTTLATGPGTADAAVRFLQFFGFFLGSSESVLYGSITDREEAVDLADDMRNALADTLAIIEADEAATGYIAPQSAIADLQALVAATSSLLLERSFALPIERRMTLSEDRTPLDLVYQLYGGIDELDEFIEQNSLQDDEIYLIPRGRQVVYYAQ